MLRNPLKSLPRYIKYLFLSLAGVYVSMMIPLFYLYPKNNLPNRINFKLEYFDSLASGLDGDCYRLARSFVKECPFPARRIHLNSEHTIVEIQLNGKWYAYDPLYKKFFDRQNTIQISFDVSRGYIPEFLQDYPYTDAFKKVRYYHNLYFMILNYTHPYYDRILRIYYGLVK